VRAEISLQLAERQYPAPDADDAGLLRWEAFFDTAAAIGARIT
jgi:hypothetical protein